MNSANKEQRECVNNDVIWSGLVEVKTSDADVDEQIIDGGNKFHVHQSQAQIEIHLAFTWRSPDHHLTLP